MRVKRLQQGAKNHLNFAFLIPTLASYALEMGRFALERATAQLSCTVRPVLFMHWDDPTLLDAVEGFDGCFLNPIPEPLPENVAERLRRREHPVVVVDRDFSRYGIPSIELFPPVYVQRLLDHLDALGHKQIGCLNTQPDNTEIRRGYRHASHRTRWRCRRSQRLLSQGLRRRRPSHRGRLQNQIGVRRLRRRCCSGPGTGLRRGPAERRRRHGIRRI